MIPLELNAPKQIFESTLFLFSSMNHLMQPINVFMVIKKEASVISTSLQFLFLFLI